MGGVSSISKTSLHSMIYTHYTLTITLVRSYLTRSKSRSTKPFGRIHPVETCSVFASATRGFSRRLRSGGPPTHSQTTQRLERVGLGESHTWQSECAFYSGDTRVVWLTNHSSVSTLHR